MIERFEATRFEIMGRKRDRRVLRFRGRAMKKRERVGIVFLGKGHFRQCVGCRPGKFALSVVIQDSLKIRPRRGGLVQIAVALPQREIRIRPSGRARIIVEVFLVFRNRKVVQLPSEERVGILELTLFRLLGLRRRCFRCFFRRHGACHRRLWRWRTRAGRRLRAIDIDKPKQHRQSEKTGRAARNFHFAVAKATFDIPASVQIFKTLMIFL